jgi:hypothetical protein
MVQQASSNSSSSSSRKLAGQQQLLLLQVMRSCYLAGCHLALTPRWQSLPAAPAAHPFLLQL